jgi:hypothetical protein
VATADVRTILAQLDIASIMHCGFGQDAGRQEFIHGQMPACRCQLGSGGSQLPR